MKDISEKTKQMTKIYELWKEEYTGDWFVHEDGREEKTLIASYGENMKKIAEKEAERLREMERKKDGWRTHYHVTAKLVETDIDSTESDPMYHNTLKEALDNLTEEDADYTLIKHKLLENEEVKKHKHKNYNEWVILNYGRLEVIVDSERKTIDSNGLSEICSIFFPKNKYHSAKALSKTDYYVLRRKEL